MNVLTVVRCQGRSVGSTGQVEVDERNVVTASCASAALQPSGLLDSTLGVSINIAGRSLPELELAGLAILAEVTLVVLALPHEEGLLARTVEVDVLNDNVLSDTKTAAAAVGRVALGDTAPGLEVDGVGGVVHGQVLGEEVVDVLVFTVVLADRANGEALAAPELAVEHLDVAGVALEGDAVVARGDLPAQKGNVVRVDGVDAVGVERVPLAGRSVVDVDVGELEVLGVGDGHGPHLALHEAHALHHRVGHVAPVDHHRAMRQVALVLGPVVPDLAVAVEGANAVAVPMDVVAAKVPHGALILEANWHGHRQPVVDVGAPLEVAVVLDLHVVKLVGRHVGLDGIRRAGEDDQALFAALCVKRMHDGRRIVFAIARGQNVADLSALVLGLLLPVGLVCGSGGNVLVNRGGFTGEQPWVLLHRGRHRSN